MYLQIPNENQFSNSFESPRSHEFGEDTWLDGETNKPIEGKLVDVSFKVATGVIPTGDIFLTFSLFANFSSMFLNPNIFSN